MKLGDFENKAVIVSGGSSGIGKCIAEQFLKENAKVIIIDKSDCNTKCNFFFKGDLTEYETVAKFAEQVKEKYGKIDFIINNAGLTKGEPNDIANMVLFLCSDKAKFITVENITIDGGMSKLMVYHNYYGWEYKK